MTIPLLERAAVESDQDRAAYDTILQKTSYGTVPNFFKALAGQPGVVSTLFDYELASFKGPLPGRLNYLVRLRVSLLNGCLYCYRAYLHGARKQGVNDEQLAALREPHGLEQDGLFTPEERAALRFADLLTTRPASVSETDREALAAHLAPDSIRHLVLVVANVNLSNRISEGLGFPVDL